MHLLDGSLNLPQERHSHGLRRCACVEASRGSFEGAADAIERGTGQRVGKRQLEALVRRGPVDVGAFYVARSGVTGEPGDVLVLSCDGKGIVMRPDSLRPATARAVAAHARKLSTRLSKGEKWARKPMSELGYPTALAAGWPIATGIIEGACRHIVADRMDLTGARWSVDGAEAVLKLRAVRANGDFDDYWRHHVAEERKRVHESRYENGAIPVAA